MKFNLPRKNTVKVADSENLKLKKLVEKINCYQPVTVQVDVKKPEYLVGHCWYNAFDAAQGKLENIVHGWLFWEVGEYTVGQHHAVVRDQSQASSMLDVTPNDANVSSVLFAESVSHKFNYKELKGWVNVACDDPNQLIIKQLNGEQRVINENYLNIGRSKLTPSAANLAKIRVLCPIAGSEL